MAGKANISVTALVVLICVSIFLAGAGFYLLQKERVKNLVLEERFQELSSLKIQLEAKLKEQERLISELQLKIQESKLEIEKLKKALESEEKEKEESKAQIEQLKVDLEIQKNSRTDTEKKLTQAQDDLKKLEAQLKILESRKSELELKVKELEAKSQEVELGKIIVKPESLSDKPDYLADQPLKDEVVSIPTLEGKILAVNKDYNFAVINLGTNDGLGPGDIFSVYRDSKYLGEVKLEKVNDSMSAAAFLSADLRDKVSQNDRVVQKVK